MAVLYAAFGCSMKMFSLRSPWRNAFFVHLINTEVFCSDMGRSRNVQSFKTGANVSTNPFHDAVRIQASQSCFIPNSLALYRAMSDLSTQCQSARESMFRFAWREEYLRFVFLRRANFKLYCNSPKVLFFLIGGPSKGTFYFRNICI